MLTLDFCITHLYIAFFQPIHLNDKGYYIIEKINISDPISNTPCYSERRVSSQSSLRLILITGSDTVDFAEKHSFWLSPTMDRGTLK